MESNLDGGPVLPLGRHLAEGDEPTEPLAMDEAHEILAAIAADQVATRSAAAPPRWYLLTVSTALGSMFALCAIPDSFEGLRTMGAGLICLLEGALVLWLMRHRTVRTGRGGVLAPFRLAVVPVIVVFIVIFVLIAVACAPSIRALIPWWAYLGIGVCVACLTYVLVRWSWRDWSHLSSCC